MELTKTHEARKVIMRTASWKYKTLIKILISDLDPDWSFMNLNYLNIKLGPTPNTAKMNYSKRLLIINTV